jgi:hypothetical protein
MPRVRFEPVVSEFVQTEIDHASDQVATEIGATCSPATNLGKKRKTWNASGRGLIITTKTELHGLSSRANYTDRMTAACQRS